MGQSCKFLTDLTPTKFSSSAASVYPKYLLEQMQESKKGKTIWITELDKVLQQNSEQMLMDC